MTRTKTAKAKAPARRGRGAPKSSDQKIVTYLWFHDRAEEAATFYVSLFEDSKVLSVFRTGDHALLVTFQLAGQQFIALNGGPQFTFTEATSLYVNCESQEEVDDLWARLTADGGAPSMCGWLKDKFGLSWQIIPTALPTLMNDKDPAKAKRVMDAMLTMRKIDIAMLERAHQGR